MQNERMTIEEARKFYLGAKHIIAHSDKQTIWAFDFNDEYYMHIQSVNRQIVHNKKIKVGSGGTGNDILNNIISDKRLGSQYIMLRINNQDIANLDKMITDVH